MGKYCVHTVQRDPAVDPQDHSLRTQRTDPTSQKAKKPLDMQFDPQQTDLDEPKHGQEDPSGEAHTGGNTFAGGVRCPYPYSEHAFTQPRRAGATLRA